MKVIIAGSRNITDVAHVQRAKNESPFNHHITEIVSGGAKGVDQLGEKLARFKGIKCTEFPAKWKDLDAPGALVKEGTFGKYNAKAGFARNEQMAFYADAALIVWDGESKGTAHMIECMRALNKPVYIHQVK